MIAQGKKILIESFIQTISVGEKSITLDNGFYLEIITRKLFLYSFLFIVKTITVTLKFFSGSAASPDSCVCIHSFLELGFAVR